MLLICVRAVAIATTVFNPIILALGWAYYPTLFGSVLSLIGGSILSCCCCPLNKGNLKSNMMAAAILCMLGTCVKFQQVVHTCDRTVGINGIDYDTAGACTVYGEGKCWTFTTGCGQFFQETCVCYDTKDKCETVRETCNAQVYDGNDCFTWIANSKDGCYEMDGANSNYKSAGSMGMYKYCNADTKYWSDCESGDNYGYTCVNECEDKLDAARIKEKSAHEAELYFRKPYSVLMVAALICDLGVFIFGLLAGIENDFRGGDGGAGSITAVTAKKAKKTAV